MTTTCLLYTSPRAHFAQRSIELIHEIAAIGQSGEGVVIARVIKALLQVLALLDLGAQARAQCMLPLPGNGESLLQPTQTVGEIVRAKGCLLYTSRCV